MQRPGGRRSNPGSTPLTHVVRYLTDAWWHEHGAQGVCMWGGQNELLNIWPTKATA